MGQLLKQSTAANITVLMIDSNDHVTGKTGLTLTIYASKAGGTPAAITPTVTELSSSNTPGLYKLALTSGHTDTLGELQLHVTGSGADPTDVAHQVVLDLFGTAQTGDSYARIGAPAGASISSDIAAKPSSSTISAAVVDQALSGHTTSGTVGKALSDAAAGGGGGGSDPWLTALPGAYSAGSAGAILGGYVAPNNSNIAAIKAKTDNLPASPAAVSDIPTANANADALLDRTAGVETSRTMRQALRLMLAALTGKVSGAATATVVIRDTNDTKNRITATVDGNGNRSAVSYDAS